jgi:HSP20 family molecular chaperone IbpA
MIKAFRNLLTSVDFLNTLHGGVTEPHVSIRQEAEGHEVRVRVPGINKESLQVEIIDNDLTVFYSMPISSYGKAIPMQKIVYNAAIPYFIELKRIKAAYEENELVVKLPFNKLSDGYNRKIKIDKE